MDQMTDRELLELAAKAAKLRLKWDGEAAMCQPLYVKSDNYMWFSPLTMIDDAMFLAVELWFRVEVGLDGQAYVWLGDRLLWNEFALDHNRVDQRMRALCRAITKAAALVGKSMP